MTPFEALDQSIDRTRAELLDSGVNAHLIYEFKTESWAAILNSAPARVAHDAALIGQFSWKGATCREKPFP